MSYEGPFLRLRQISKTFAAEPGKASSTHVIDSVSMDIEAGAFVGFLWPFGCGKINFIGIVGGVKGSTGGETFLTGQK